MSKPTVSDRERDGLRGPVELCIEGEVTREYDRDGKSLELLGVDVDGSRWGTRWTYDSDGKLLRTTRIVRDCTYGASGEIVRRGPLHGTSVEQVYSYDQAGRLVSFTDGFGGRTDFRYDEQGRKTKVVTITPQPHASSGIPEFSAVIDFAERGNAIRLKGGVSPHCTTIATSQPKCKFGITMELLCNASCGATTRTDDSSIRN